MKRESIIEKSGSNVGIEEYVDVVIKKNYYEYTYVLKYWFNYY